MMTRLYFARHGESEANLRRVFANRGDGPPLTDRGRRQAELLARRLAGHRIQHIHTSPLSRARQTAEIIASRLGIGCTLAEALREYDVGSFEGASSAEGWRTYDDVLEDWLLHGRLERTTGGGESFLDIERRFAPFVASLCGQPDLRACLLVTHGGLLRVMLPQVLANVSRSFSFHHVLGHAELVVADDESGALSVGHWDGAAGFGR